MCAKAPPHSACATLEVHTASQARVPARRDWDRDCKPSLACSHDLLQLERTVVIGMMNRCYDNAALPSGRVEALQRACAAWRCLRAFGVFQPTYCKHSGHVLLS